VDASAVADLMEYLCIVDNSYLVSRSCSERVLIEMSEDLLWYRAVDHLLDRLCDISALCPVTASRLIVCLLNALMVAIGSTDIMLIDHACLDESHWLSVFEEQVADMPSDLVESGCKLAAKLLEYQLVDMPLVSVHRHKMSRSFSSQTICKIADKLLLICCETDRVELSGIIAHGKCQQMVGITWLHPMVMWSLRQKIFMHGLSELASTDFDLCTDAKIVTVCAELYEVKDVINVSVSKLMELQENPQHQYERALFIIRHRLEGYEG